MNLLVLWGKPKFNSFMADRLSSICITHKIIIETGKIERLMCGDEFRPTVTKHSHRAIIPSGNTAEIVHDNLMYNCIDKVDH